MWRCGSVYQLLFLCRSLPRAPPSSRLSELLGTKISIFHRRKILVVGKESAVGKMATLIILQQHACEKQHACERVKICSPTSRNTPTSQRLLILRSPCVAESYFLLEQKPVNSIHFRNGWMKFTLFPNQDLQALHTGGKQ